jgi:hypothetical protein
VATYVDDMRAGFGRMIMCHLIADTEAELLAMVDKIGVARRWHQHAGTHRSHFDIALSKRAQAVKFGAMEITWKQLGCMTARRRITGLLGSPDDAIEWRRNLEVTPGNFLP